MSSIPIEVAQVTANTTYTGEGRLYWITVTADGAIAVVSLKDGTTEWLRIRCLEDDTHHIIFQPSVPFKTSLVITEEAGSATITTARTGGI